MEEKRTDKNSYTIIFSIVMMVVVGAVLAFVASILSDRISQNQKIETQQNILYAMGINENENPYSGSGSLAYVPTDQAQEYFDEYITKQYVIQGEEMIEDAEAYLIDIKREADLSKNPDYTRRLPLFIGEDEGDEYYIIPMRGNGLWDAIWGYMAINPDMTVHGVIFDHAGETPGLGSNIRERFFMDDFHGESLTDDNNNFQGIRVAKGNMDPLNERKDDHKVDAIAGSTITGDGVTNMISEAIDLYGPYLLKLANEN